MSGVVIAKDIFEGEFDYYAGFEHTGGCCDEQEFVCRDHNSVIRLSDKEYVLVGLGDGWIGAVKVTDLIALFPENPKVEAND